MGNTEISARNILKIEYNYSTIDIYMKDGTIERNVNYNNGFMDNKYQLNRLENYLGRKYSSHVDAQLDKKIKEANNERCPIRFLLHDIIFDDTNNDTNKNKNRNNNTNNKRMEYFKDMMSYNKLTVHRVHFESMFNKVLANDESVYSQEFYDKWNTEKTNFLNNLKKKIDNFNQSKL
jgi:hypothetical protein